MTKFYVEISTDPHTGYGPKVGWDTLYASKLDAYEAALRAENKFAEVKVSQVDVPEHVDHLYRCVADARDQTYLYA